MSFVDIATCSTLSLLPICSQVPADQILLKADQTANKQNLKGKTKGGKEKKSGKKKISKRRATLKRKNSRASSVEDMGTDDWDPAVKKPTRKRKARHGKRSTPPADDEADEMPTARGRRKTVMAGTDAEAPAKTKAESGAKAKAKAKGKAKAAAKATATAEDAADTEAVPKARAKGKAKAKATTRAMQRPRLERLHRQSHSPKGSHAKGGVLLGSLTESHSIMTRP